MTDTEITTQFIGRSVCMGKLAKYSHNNRATEEGVECIVYSCGFLYDQELRELFGITDKLKELWERRGTEFNLHLIISDQKIVACHISKYHESEGARPGYRSLKCTQQDLRIVRKILQYITVEF